FGLRISDFGFQIHRKPTAEFRRSIVSASSSRQAATGRHRLETNFATAARIRCGEQCEPEKLPMPIAVSSGGREPGQPDRRTVDDESQTVLRPRETKGFR